MISSSVLHPCWSCIVSKHWNSAQTLLGLNTFWKDNSWRPQVAIAFCLVFVDVLQQRAVGSAAWNGAFLFHCFWACRLGTPKQGNPMDLYGWVRVLDCRLLGLRPSLLHQTHGSFGEASACVIAPWLYRASAMSAYQKLDGLRVVQLLATWHTHLAETCCTVTHWNSRKNVDIRFYILYLLMIAVSSHSTVVPHPLVEMLIFCLELLNQR